MTKRRHAIEEMRGMLRARADRFERLIVGGRRVPERDSRNSRREPSNQFESAVQLRRDGDDADVGCGALDLAKDVDRGELAVWTRILSRRAQAARRLRARVCR